MILSCSYQLLTGDWGERGTLNLIVVTHGILGGIVLFLGSMQWSWLICEDSTLGFWFP
jgi:hypothetical protein